MSQSWIKSVLFSLGMVVTGQRAIATESPPPKTESAATAIFAGGCFWCTESDFEKVPGVIDAQSGYTGGKAVNPTYEQVSAGGTGHTEAVRVTYDPARVSYAQLVDFFWRTIDPTEKDRQFCDVGDQYRSGIYWGTDAERQVAEASLAKLKESGRFKNIYTEVKKADPFYVAEDYHQDYYAHNPSQGYCAYVVGPKVVKFRQTFARFLK